MDKKYFEVIRDSIWHLKNTISALACENYPMTPFLDDEMRDMFYDLNDMYLTITDKIRSLEKE